MEIVILWITHLINYFCISTSALALGLYSADYLNYFFNFWFYNHHIKWKLFFWFCCFPQHYARMIVIHVTHSRWTRTARPTKKVRDHTPCTWQCILIWTPSGSSILKVTINPKPVRVMFDHTSCRIASQQSKIYFQLLKMCFGKANRSGKRCPIEVRVRIGCLWIVRWGSSKDGTKNSNMKIGRKLRSCLKLNIGKFLVEDMLSKIKDVLTTMISSKISSWDFISSRHNLIIIQKWQ